MFSNHCFIASLLFLTSFTTSSIVYGSTLLEVDLKDITLEYFEKGDGDPIVGVHGAVSDYRVWNSYADSLSEKNKFIGYTRRFYGDQDWPEGDNIYNASVHAEDLIGLIESLNIAPVHAFSRSSGGYGVVIAAKKRPELFRSLILWEPFVGNDLIPSVSVSEEQMKSYKKWGSGYVPYVKAAKAGETDTAIKHFIEHVYELNDGSFDSLPSEQKQIFSDNARTLSLLVKGKTTDKVTCEYLGEISVPALVIRGSETFQGYALRHTVAADCLASAEVVVIDGVVHNGIGQKVDEVSEVIHSYIGRL